MNAGPGPRHLRRDLDRPAEGHPPEEIPDLGGRARELALDVRAALVEVPPALVVDRDHHARAQAGAQGHRLARGHRVVHRAGHGEAHRPQVEQGDVHAQPLGDLRDAVVEDRVAGDPQHAVLLALPRQREADHVAHDRPAERGAVAARRGGDPDGGPPAASSRVERPGRQAARAASQAAGPGHGGHHRPRHAGSRARPAGSRLSPWWSWVSSTASIGGSVGGGHRRPGHLARAGAPAEAVVAAGRVEGGVGQQPPPADLDQDRRTADVGDPHPVHGVLPGRRQAVACLTAQSSAKSAISSQPSMEGSRCGPSYSMISVTVSDL